MGTNVTCDGWVSEEAALSFLGLHCVWVCAAQDVSLRSPSVGGAKALMISEALGGRWECVEAAPECLGLWWV